MMCKRMTRASHLICLLPRLNGMLCYSSQDVMHPDSDSIRNRQVWCSSVPPSGGYDSDHWVDHGLPQHDRRSWLAHSTTSYSFGPCADALRQLWWCQPASFLVVELRRRGTGCWVDKHRARITNGL